MLTLAATQTRADLMGLRRRIDFKWNIVPYVKVLNDDDKNEDDRKEDDHKDYNRHRSDHAMVVDRSADNNNNNNNNKKKRNDQPSKETLVKKRTRRSLQ